jgi:ribosome-associated translation inhibitor RaiA
LTPAHVETQKDATVIPPPPQPDAPVRHRLRIEFDTHECRPGQAELDALADGCDSLARQVGDFPQADLRIVIEHKARTTEFVVKLTLLLPGRTLVTSHHDPHIHPAFDRAMASLEDAVRAYKDSLGGVEERRKAENGTHQLLTPDTPVDAAALDDAAMAGDYPAFRAAVAGYEGPLRLRVGRWVERYSAVQGRIGKGLETVDVAEAVLLVAFEGHPSRPPGVPYGQWLEGLIDDAVRAFEHDPDGELENVNMARSACEATPTATK